MRTVTGPRLIAFDTKLRRPGCVIVQALLGGTVTATELEMDFGSDTWLDLTPDMKLLPVTDEQYAMCIHMAKRSIQK